MHRRTRLRVAPITRELRNVRRNFDGTLTGPSSTSLSGHDHYSSITDVTGKVRDQSYPGSNRKRYGFTPVDHSNVRVDSCYNAPILGSSSRSYETGKVALNEWRAPVPAEILMQHVVTSSEAEISDFAHEAFLSLSAQMPEEISIPNFLIEAKDITSLLPSIKTKLSRIEVGSNGLLSWEFGMKPLLGDLQTLDGLLNTVKTRIEFLKSTRGKRVRLGAYKKLVRPAGSWSYLQTTGGALSDTSAGLGFVYALHSVESHYRAGGYLYHELNNLDSLDSLLRALLVATGFGNPLKVAWNAIPYSFVVDWVSNVSSLLDSSASVKPFVGLWRFDEFGWSVKDYAEFTIWSDPYYLRHPDLVYTRVGRSQATRYRRGPGLPAKVIRLLLPPSQREALLMTALLR